jgi:hypothetical protein
MVPLSTRGWGHFGTDNDEIGIVYGIEIDAKNTYISKSTNTPQWSDASVPYFSTF